MREHVHPLSVLATSAGQAALKSADIVFGHDESRGGCPVLFFGKEMLEQIAADLAPAPANVFRVSYDQRTEQLEYLTAAVQVLKGSHCYASTMPAPKIETWALPDSTIEVHTTDADPYFAEDRARGDVELQAALDAFRAGGVPRPVLFTYDGADQKAAQIWRKLDPALMAKGKAITNAADQWVPDYVIATDVARLLLRPLVGKSAARLFRTPTWPVGYWTVLIGSGDPTVYETRTFKDEARAEGA